MPEFISQKPYLAAAVAALLFAISAGSQPNLKTTIVLNPHAPGRIFEGIGALSAGASTRLLVDYPEPQRSQILDYLFKPAYGAALQHLKVEVGADVNSTDGSEPSHMRSPDDHNYTRGYEWWLMQEAVKRNPAIILDILPWGAPGWIGNGKLYSADMAAYMADFIEGAKKLYGLHIRYAGIWNEKEYDSEYVKQLKRTLLARKLDTKIVCCDDYYGEHQWRIAKEMRDDPELRAAVDVIGVHYPRTEDGALTTTQDAEASGKPLWSSEDQPNSGGGPIVPRIWNVGGKILASTYNRNYLEGAMTKTEIWSPITSYYDNLAAPNSGLMYANTPWSGYYDVQSTIWVTAHTTQFAQPGWQYLDPACGHLPDYGSYVSLRSPDLKNWSLIAETISAKNQQTVEVRIEGTLNSGTVHVWQTNAAHTFEHVTDLKPANGILTLTLEPESLYTLSTTTGQAKGTAQPPVNRPFPFPYQDDFDKTPLARAARYLADQDGAFEAHPCRERPGQCLEQVIERKPIPWGPLPDPFTMAGDANWSDYTVSADVLMNTASDATLMGRIDTADVFADSHARWPSGYVLQLNHDGSWLLFSAAFKRAPQTLASGTNKTAAAGWHTLRLTFRGSEIAATLDGLPLATVRDTRHTAGMIAIGADWGTAQFDNLSIHP